MIFLGRPLALRGRVSIWEQPEGDGYSLHLVERGLILELDGPEMNELAEAVTAALAHRAEPESDHDRIRRLQVLDARVRSFVQRAKHPGPESA